MKTITFAVTDNQSAVFGVETDEITTEQKGEEDQMRIGEYEYESDPAFGSPTTANGELYADMDTNLIAIITHHDNPKAKQLFRKLEDTIETDITAPEYPQEASEQLYRTFGFNGYTTSLRSDLMDYGLHASPNYIDPEERMREAAMHSRRDPSDDWVDEIANDLLEDGHYVSSMDCMFEDDGDSYSFSNPMRITGIPADEWTDALRNLLFERMRQLYTNTVPTTEEVLNTA